jgi:hypothetical protein
MIIDQIRGALQAQPFQPFAVKLVDGTAYTVEHHDWISIPPVRRPREITYYAVRQKGDEDYQTHWINLGLILEIIVPAELAAKTPKAEGNGA